MLSLKKGTYLGNLDKYVRQNAFMVSLTSYGEREEQEQMHCHENTHISFVLQGGSAEKRKNKNEERLPGKITFYHAGEYHQSTELRHFTRHINVELDRKLLPENTIHNNQLDVGIAKNPESKFILLKLYQELQNEDANSSETMNMLVLDLINPCAFFSYQRKRPSWVDQVEEAARGHWRERLSLDQLSTMVNVHPVTISKYFHRYFKCTLGEYTRKLKIEKSLELIKTSTLQLSQIAYECGFADQSHFIRTFKDVTGFLPRDFKNS